MRRILIVLAGFVGAFTLGILLFNFVVMPRLVQHDHAVRVPRIVGLTAEEAQRACRQVGLQSYEEERRHSDGVARGQVMSQEPQAGTSVKLGRTVRILVSLGPQAVTVPDLRGMTERQATLQLENAKLKKGRVSKVFGAASGPSVRASRPRAGAEAALGDSVNLLVAVGEASEPFLMPRLEGRDLADVRALIEARGFRVGRVTYRSAQGVYPGTVLQQYPDSGSLLRPGDSIDLVAATPE